MKNTLRLRKALILLSLTVIGNYSAKALVRDPFFASFNELFEELDIHSRPAKSSEACEKELNAQAASLQNEIKKLAKAADDLTSELKKNIKERNTEQALAIVRESQIIIDNTVQGIRRSLRNESRSRVTEEADKTPKCTMQTHSDENTNSFVVTASLPDITQEDLKITVNTTDEFGKERQTLRVSAQQKTTRASSPGFFSTSSFSSTRNINGRREELSVENGLVTIIIDLPQNTHTDLSEVQKTMRFDKNILTLSFPTNKKDLKKETVLRFNSKPTQVSEVINLK
jgi:HSP20 family molecular chaperone IbpA